MEGTPIRVLVVDDQELIRRGMQLMLSFEPDIQVVGQAADGAQAVAAALALSPDVILMDLHMPVKGGVAATREITILRPGIRVLVLTTLETEETVFEAIRAGAQAYLLKDASEQELLDTIRRVYQGESVLTPRIASKVLDEFRRGAGSTHRMDEAARSHGAPGTGEDDVLRSAQACALPAPQDPPSAPLTEREERILALIVEGRSNKEIARAVFLAEGTVRNYVSRILEKFHANSRTELAVRSLRERPAPARGS